jgi:hypothetical protein
MSCLKVPKPTNGSAVCDFIMKKTAEGKPNKAAETAWLNKFLRIYYAGAKEHLNNHYGGQSPALSQGADCKIFVPVCQTKNLQYYP